jgi:acyl-CoA dehydrogenase
LSVKKLNFFFSNPVIPHQQVNGDQVIVHGRKWWASGAGDPRCRLAIFLGLHRNGSDAASSAAGLHRRHSIVLVPMPHPGVKILRPLNVFGFDDAPHGHMEMTFTDVAVNARAAVVGAPGDGFRIAQGRLGGGRVHHAMRMVGVGTRAAGMAITRAQSRRGACRRGVFHTHCDRSLFSIYFFLKISLAV